MDAAHTFLRHTLWRPADSLPEPLVALLGPSGSGKSSALDALSHACGGTVVHAKIDFAEREGRDPVAALAVIVFKLMRGWSNQRRDLTFHRFGLGLLALNENLAQGEREASRRYTQTTIQQYVSRTRLGRAAEATVDIANDVVQVVNTVSSLAGAPLDVTLKANRYAVTLIRTLLRGVARFQVHGALKWHSSIPEAEDADAIDALIALSQNSNRDRVLAYLMEAFLADVEDNMARHPEIRSKCACRAPAEYARHAHSWVLLVDNAYTSFGEQFLNALLRVRCERRRQWKPRFDPLLVITAAGQWNSAWNQWWRKPWLTASAEPEKSAVPLASAASRDEWIRHTRNAGDQVGTNTDFGWYPVWLDRLSGPAIMEVGRALDAGGDTGVLLERVTAGHPAALSELRDETSAGRRVLEGDGRIVAEVLARAGQDGSPFWLRALRARLPGDLIPGTPWRTVPELVSIVAHLTYPARTSDLPNDEHPDVARILRDLQENLWISTQFAQPSPLWPVGHTHTEHPAAVHPWLLLCLLTGLAEESRSEEDFSSENLWHSLFNKPPARPGHAERRDLFRGLANIRDLADQQFTWVVEELSAQFDKIDHCAWVGLLDDVTCAPCLFPRKHRIEDSYRELVPDAPDRTPLQANVSSLTALLWLYHDPLTVPQPHWNRRIASNFARLIALSNRVDVTALQDAERKYKA